MLTRKSPAGGQGSNGARPSVSGRGETTRPELPASFKTDHCAALMVLAYRRHA